MLLFSGAFSNVNEFLTSGQTNTFIKSQFIKTGQLQGDRYSLSGLTTRAVLRVSLVFAVYLVFVRTGIGCQVPPAE